MINPDPDCPICFGAGWIDKGDGYEIECECSEYERSVTGYEDSDDSDESSEDESGEWDEEYPEDDEEDTEDDEEDTEDDENSPGLFSRIADGIREGIRGAFSDWWEDDGDEEE